jgi:hypothetical protein
MSKIEVNAVEPQSGTTLTLGASGDTVALAAGATCKLDLEATYNGAVNWSSTIKFSRILQQFQEMVIFVTHQVQHLQ